MENDEKTKGWLKYNIKPNHQRSHAGLLSPERQAFCFGIEAEFIVTERATFTPLWHADLNFSTLYKILDEAVPVDASYLGLKLEPPHARPLPYVVEGYHVNDAAMQPIDILPKGLEIRTPVTTSLQDCLQSLTQLYEHLDARLAQHGYALTALSHHPVGLGFDGPQNKRRHDYWRWAVEAMHTYGPDINVGLPASVEAELCPDDLQRKINYYAPALTALSLNSPLVAGRLWEVDGEFGRSFRTYRRSVIAPAVELHPDQNGRMEFKSFEMTNDLADFGGYFLLWLTLLLERGQLRGRDMAQARIYGLGQVAIGGLAQDRTRQRISEVLDVAYQVLPCWGFDPQPLDHFAQRLASRCTPADQLISELQNGASVNEVLAARSQLVDSRLAHHHNRQVVNS